MSGTRAHMFEFYVPQKIWMNLDKVVDDPTSAEDKKKKKNKYQMPPNQTQWNPGIQILVKEGETKWK